MSRLWGWVAAGFGFMVAALLLVAGQRDKARAKAKQARVDLQASQANREADTVARQAQEKARQEAAEVQREADDRPDDQRPTGPLRR